MKNKQIVFTKINTAELLDRDIEITDSRQVLVKTCFSTISCGTERANITGDPNCSAVPGVVFPRYSGYSSTGIVLEVGEDVKSVRPGDRVTVSWGTHSMYNVVDEENVVKIEDDSISLEEAALFHIYTFPLAAVRKTKIELGESAMVMGLGILGLFAVQLAKASGAIPVIAVDPVASRRELALKLGADHAFDPFDKEFADKVKNVTGGGVNAAIEVTGVGAGLDECLDCMAKYGRIALLGCTRNSDFTIDYYRKVHVPGISLIGAHTMARPKWESYPGYFTQREDIRTLQKMCSFGRLKNLKEMIFEVHSPTECMEVYTRLVEDREFPPIVMFDWSKLEGSRV